MRKFFFTAVCLAGLCAAASASGPAPAEGGVMFTVDARARIEPMKPIWAWVGYDEPNYTYKI